MCQKRALKDITNVDLPNIIQLDLDSDDMDLTSEESIPPDFESIHEIEQQEQEEQSFIMECESLKMDILSDYPNGAEPIIQRFLAKNVFDHFYENYSEMNLFVHDNTEYILLHSICYFRFPFVYSCLQCSPGDITRVRELHCGFRKGQDLLNDIMEFPNRYFCADCNQFMFTINEVDSIECVTCDIGFSFDTPSHFTVNEG